jgi:hypothetical protein
MRKWTFILLLFVAPVQANTFLEFGMPFFQVSEGVWIDTRYDHEINQENPSWNVGKMFEISEKVDAVLRYGHVGTLRIDSLGLCDDTRSERTATCRFQSHTPVKGFSLGLKWKLAKFFKEDIELEGGQFIGRIPVQVVMPDMPVGYTEDGTPFGSNTAVSSHKALWVVNPYVGVSIGTGKKSSFSVRYTKLDDNRTRDGYAPATPGVFNLVTKLNF